MCPSNFLRGRPLCILVPSNSAEVSTTEVGKAEIGIAEVSIAKGGTAEVSPDEVSVAKGGPTETGIAEVGSAEVGPVELGIDEVYPNAKILFSPLIPGIYTLPQ